MTINIAKASVNAISKVTLKNTLLCIYRYDFNPTIIPYLLIPLQNVRSVNIFPGTTNDSRFTTVFFFKSGEKEVLDWNYRYNSGYGSATTSWKWKEEVEKQIEDMVELIATASTGEADGG